MPAAVSPYPTGIVRLPATAGGLVRASHWLPFASLVNHTIGKSYTAIPWTMPGVTLTAGTGYRIGLIAARPYSTLDLLWGVQMHGTTTTSGGTCTIKMPATGTARTITALPAPGALQTLPTELIRRQITQGHGELETSIGITNLSASLVLRGFGAWTFPRVRLRTDGNILSGADGGVETLEYRGGEPIFSASAAGFNRLARAVSFQPRIGPKCGLFTWAVPYRRESGTQIDTYARAITATTYGGEGSTSDMFGLAIPIEGRMPPGDLVFSTTAYVRFLARIDGAGGEIKVTGWAGFTTTTAAVTSATYAWVPALTAPPMQVAIGMMDNDNTNGVGSGGWGTCLFEGKVSSGTLRIASVCVWEKTE